MNCFILCYCNFSAHVRTKRSLSTFFFANTNFCFAADFNQLDTKFLSSDYDLTQIVDHPTHGQRYLIRYLLDAETNDDNYSIYT